MKKTYITKSHIDFIINEDVTIRFVYMTEDYTACIYYKGMYDGRVQNLRYKTATKENAQSIYLAYVEQENERMRNQISDPPSLYVAMPFVRSSLYPATTQKMNFTKH